jgi:hypothetical protein
MKAFLDMDGVLTDFVGGCCKLLGKDMPDCRGSWEFFKLWGLTEKAFWQKIDREGESFWADLEWLPDGMEILRLVERNFGKENVCLLTSPSWHPSSHAGKRIWIDRQLSDYRERYIITPCKYLVAGPGKFLLDDSDRNLQSWCHLTGASGLLVPRPWNSQWEFADPGVPLAVVQTGLKAFKQ